MSPGASARLQHQCTRGSVSAALPGSEPFPAPDFPHPLPKSGPQEPALTCVAHLPQLSGLTPSDHGPARLGRSHLLNPRQPGTKLERGVGVASPRG